MQHEWTSIERQELLRSALRGGSTIFTVSYGYLAIVLALLFCASHIMDSAVVRRFHLFGSGAVGLLTVVVMYWLAFAAKRLVRIETYLEVTDSDGWYARLARFETQAQHSESERRFPPRRNDPISDEESDEILDSERPRSGQAARQRIGHTTAVSRAAPKKRRNVPLLFLPWTLWLPQFGCTLLALETEQPVICSIATATVGLHVLAHILFARAVDIVRAEATWRSVLAEAPSASPIDPPIVHR
ncbi:MAG: hypothetical protein AAF517_09480 [Planctomycetota bacterium]